MSSNKLSKEIIERVYHNRVCHVYTLNHPLSHNP